MGSSAASLTSTRSYGAALYNHGRRSAPAIRYAGHQAGVRGIVMVLVVGLVFDSTQLLVPVIICGGKPRP